LEALAGGLAWTSNTFPDLRHILNITKNTIKGAASATNTIRWK
jgi:hypothetical protein